MSFSVRRLREVLAVCATAALLVPAAAYPCGSRMLYERLHRPADSEVLRVAQADLKAGRDQAALSGARRLLSRERQRSASEVGLGLAFFDEDYSLPPNAANLKWARRVAGVALLRLGRSDEALMYLSHAAREFKNEPYVLAKLGQAELGAGKTAEGKARLEALEKKQLLPDADSQVALARARLADFDHAGALAAVSSALGQDPKHAPALALKASLASQLEAKPDPMAGARAEVIR
jgi:tetratricopeptide (TPR) repeat protein